MDRIIKSDVGVKRVNMSRVIRYSPHGELTVHQSVLKNSYPPSVVNPPVMIDPDRRTTILVREDNHIELPLDVFRDNKADITKFYLMTHQGIENEADQDIVDKLKSNLFKLSIDYRKH